MKRSIGSAANLNIHLHGLVLDGVYCTTGEGVPVFRPAPALTSEKLQALLGKIITRTFRPSRQTVITSGHLSVFPFTQLLQDVSRVHLPVRPDVHCTHGGETLR